MKTITIFNLQEGGTETFTPEQAFNFLENVGLWAAHEMFKASDVTRLMNFMKAE